ncbi:bifunctional glycosyltransferase/CDP-glycerol:glycerophosphate glycerophosphotransferase [Actinomadura violacea]|uniref:Bifunctional glycosyltransferase family 2 protein/CDP-glycerol:glycerophosphate glycerophosphotransferase n=1 Tax=Actinomadura violacea TaxID=2819934 RepID=A0ABS3RJA6_9ACTN|nr:bifunctional glycosyltransferase family 2 protein/CDP-glycerol:glycerophosphate glycerophosphotransferase [Actinomadura violacea]MBO2456822.1 bifunctional glycosyltransferase family 2 protein/CDP-glycerol:glycerophosphate glycerophosphotransferase [Actinomadura violacea]
MTAPRISVIVLAHGAGEDLGDALDSIAAQTFQDLEVLVVDDGTGTAARAELPDERFRIVRSGAPSRGAARNLGVAESRGEFLLFAGGGDPLPPDAVAVLLTSLEASGSDLAMGPDASREWTGQVSQWKARGDNPDPAKATDLQHSPDLLHVRKIATALVRRSFWDSAGLEFPDLGRYDDLPVMVRALHLATSVDVVPDVVLHRRSRRFPPTTEPQEIADGFGAANLATSWLAERGDVKELRRLQLALVTTELKLFLDALPDLSGEEREQVVAQAAAYAKGVSPKVFAEASALTRLKWHLAAEGHTMELVKVVRYERGKSSPSIVRDPLRRYVVYPYWKDAKVDVPREVYRARDEVKMRGRAHAVRWEGDRLVVTGEAYINSVSSRRRWTSIKTVTLRSGRRKIHLKARQTPKPGKSSGGWTGFEFALDAAKLKDRGAWAEGTWEVHASVLNAGVFRQGPVRGGGSGTGAHPPYRYVADDVRVVPKVVDGQLVVQVERVRERATALRWDGSALIIEVEAAGGPPAELVLTLGDARVPVPVAQRPGGWTARVDPDALDVDIDPDAIDDTRDWTLSADGRPLVLAEGVEEARRTSGALEVSAGHGPGGYVRVRRATTRLSVSDCVWRPDGTLSLAATHPAHASGQIVVRSRGRRKEHAFDLVPDDSGTLRAEVPAAAVPSVAGILPLRPGRWDVLFRPPGGRALTVRLTEAAQRGLPGLLEVARRGYALEAKDGRLVVAVTGDVSGEEKSAGAKYREEARRKVARDGLRDAVLFSCFNGRQYSDSPKAIHEELLRRGADLEQLWVVNDAQAELPDTLKAVRLNGREWQEAVTTSKYIVTNHRLGDWFQRHPDQVVLQTWHGTPLKKIGRDVKEVHFAYAPGMKSALQSKDKGPSGPAVPEWSHLLSPNPFSTEIFRRAFAFKGEMLEVGYPRNDLLYSPEADAVARSVRARLGIPEGKRVVLYAPTWRDDQYYSRGRYKHDMRLDLDRARAALGDDHVLLVRLHSNVVDGVTEDEHGFVRDVSLYPDITELYLISDMMISDYSSVMFDYANTGRPMLFFTYDLADYRDRLRGFYFDFEAEAPGPLVETSDDLIDAIRDVEAATAGHQDRYKEFVARFCPLDDGKAAARTVDRVFPPQS